MAKKTDKLQILRHIVQGLFYIILPGLYIMAFSQLKMLYRTIAAGNFNIIEILPGIFPLVTLLVLTIVFGRFFCGFMCLFGAFNDLIYGVSRKIFKINYKINEKTDRILKYLKYVVLIFVISVVWDLGYTSLSSFSPWEAFSQIPDIVSIIKYYPIGLILLSMIIVGSMLVERFFCRYLCPLGAVFSMISRISPTRIEKPNHTCNKCRICTTNCSMGIPLYKVNTVKGGECINCLRCVKKCPRDNSGIHFANKKIGTAWFVLLSLVSCLLIYAIGSFGIQSITKSELSPPALISTPISSLKYKDGTYEGEGAGYKRGITKVSVTIKNDMITDIKTIFTGDTPSYYSYASEIIVKSIINDQSSEVDAVSGATFTSRGIITAVEDALSKAEK